MGIPKVFHQIWVGGPCPDLYLGYSDTWRRHHPGWELRLWDESNMPTLRNQRLFDNAERYAPESMLGQFRSDVARYELIHQFGGVYVDMDFECLASIEPRLRGVRCFAVREGPGTVANGLMGAEAGHPFIGHLVDHLAGHAGRRRGRRPAQSTGPRFLTKLLTDWGGDPVQVLPQELFFPYAWNEIDHSTKTAPPWPAGTLAVHRWHNQRKHRGMDP